MEISSHVKQPDAINPVRDEWEGTPRSKNDKQEEVRNLVLKAKLNQNFLEAVFGMISFWQFDRKIRTFKCVHSYATPEIVPFSGASKQ